MNDRMTCDSLQTEAKSKLAIFGLSFSAKELRLKRCFSVEDIFRVFVKHKDVQDSPLQAWLLSRQLVNQQRMNPPMLTRCHH